MKDNEERDYGPHYIPELDPNHSSNQSSFPEQLFLIFEYVVVILGLGGVAVGVIGFLVGSTQMMSWGLICTFAACFNVMR